MGAESYYAVRKGKETGVFRSWEACKAVVSGFAGAEYKRFATEEQARAYLLLDETAGVEVEGIMQGGSPKRRVKAVSAAPSFSEAEQVIAYVDGSYDDAKKRYAFGCVLFTSDGRKETASGCENRPETLPLRNVAGEMIGAMYAVRWALTNGYRCVELRYDYQGIESWVTGAWRAKQTLTQKYAAAMRDWGTRIQIRFQKVRAHSGDTYNEEADQLAKTALTKEPGIPKIAGV